MHTSEIKFPPAHVVLFSGSEYFNYCREWWGLKRCFVSCGTQSKKIKVKNC